MLCRFHGSAASRSARGVLTSSAIRELLKVTEHPEFISFAGGLPAPEVFPTAEVAAGTERLLQRQGAQALQYGTTEGLWAAAPLDCAAK